MWDEPDCPLSQAYMDDLKQIDTVAGQASRITVPWLLVHGTEDDVVPIQDARDIFARAGEPKQLVEIEGADHVFSEDGTDPMVSQVVPWVQSQLSAL